MNIRSKWSRAKHKRLRDKYSKKYRLEYEHKKDSLEYEYQKKYKQLQMEIERYSDLNLELTTSIQDAERRIENLLKIHKEVITLHQSTLEVKTFLKATEKRRLRIVNNGK